MKDYQPFASLIDSAHDRELFARVDSQRRELDSSRKLNAILSAVCVMLAVSLIVSMRQPAPKAPRCQSPGVMQLDPETIRARQAETVEI